MRNVGFIIKIPHITCSSRCIYVELMTITIDNITKADALLTSPSNNNNGKNNSLNVPITAAIL